jgi:hypothetical protein
MTNASKTKLLTADSAPSIFWHADDLKLSHMKQEVLDNIAEKLNIEYGREVPLTIH